VKCTVRNTYTRQDVAGIVPFANGNA
jgi:hypothetical protein